jgi:hypothetical protein
MRLIMELPKGKGPYKVIHDVLFVAKSMSMHIEGIVMHIKGTIVVIGSHDSKVSSKTNL